ncbi:MAG: endopeptidase La [Deltaproteobacteria bacterium]|nr:endopeptidase La [Deltaproteobacteria bacterium]
MTEREARDAKDRPSKDVDLDEDLTEAPVPEVAPILPLRNVVVYPFTVTPIIVVSDSSKKIVDDAMVGDRIVGLVTMKDPEGAPTDPEVLHETGTIGRILKMLKFPDGTLRLLVQGYRRFRVGEIVARDPYLRARVTPVDEIEDDSIETQALFRHLSSQFQKLIEASSSLPQELQVLVGNISSPGRLADLAASSLDIPLEQKQLALETLEVRRRLEQMVKVIGRELELTRVESQIQEQVQSEMSKSQRDYLLREQLKAIQKELGEGDERENEFQEIQQKIDEAQMPEEARRASGKELEKLRRLPPGAGEYGVIRTYLDWMVSMPWSKRTEDNLDIAHARQVLDEDHYDLERVKDRILEYLAVRKLKLDMKGPILCFVGPPGTGKTSLGRSIARALGRKFVRLSLGGVHDEAEIRGHRRTYVGALPGRILQGLRKAENANPVVVLDEIDKVGTDFRGDPASALLEVLDPEQNNSFSDHYLEVPFDLSKVLFITTANLLDPIAPALRDRMEVLELPGYTAEEKLEIAKTHLIPKLLREHGLTAEQLTIEDAAVERAVSQYTREAGLRNLERELASLCRKAARRIAEDEAQTVHIGAGEIETLLGPPKYWNERVERMQAPGVAIGLAWTPQGGDILFVESSQAPGKKSLKLTGQLGDVMKESAEAALSYVRSNAEALGIDPDFFATTDLHIHVPAGAIPKDGPSAGVTMVSSIVSLLTGRRVRSDVAMTGEITLRGKVLPVGGIKEKMLAARRAGIKRVILPLRNEKDLAELPESVRSEMTFHPVERLDEVLALALEDGAERSTQPSPASRPGPVVRPVLS